MEIAVLKNNFLSSEKNFPYEKNRKNPLKMLGSSFDMSVIYEVY